MTGRRTVVRDNLLRQEPCWPARCCRTVCPAGSWAVIRPAPCPGCADVAQDFLDLVHGEDRVVQGPGAVCAGRRTVQVLSGPSSARWRWPCWRRTVSQLSTSAGVAGCRAHGMRSVRVSGVAVSGGGRRGDRRGDRLGHPLVSVRSSTGVGDRLSVLLAELGHQVGQRVAGQRDLLTAYRLGDHLAGQLVLGR